VNIDILSFEHLWMIAALVAGLPLLGAVLARAKQRHLRRLLVDRQRSLETLRAMSWQDFERMVGEVFRRMGYKVEETGGGGADGGIDLRLSRKGRRFIVQCKRYAGTVGASVVREMVGLGFHERAAGVFIVTTGRFTGAARAFARGKPVKLIDGPALLDLVRRNQSEA
jgi:restriction system protein